MEWTQKQKHLKMNFPQILIMNIERNQYTDSLKTNCIIFKLGKKRKKELLSLSYI